MSWTNEPREITIRLYKFILSLFFRYLVKKKGERTQVGIALKDEKKSTTGENFVKKFSVLIWNKINTEIIVKYTCEAKVFNQISATIVGAKRTINPTAYFWKFVSKKYDFWNKI